MGVGSFSECWCALADYSSPSVFLFPDGSVVIVMVPFLLLLFAVVSRGWQWKESIRLLFSWND